MKLTTKVPINLFFLDGFKIERAVYLSTLNKEVVVTIETKFEFSKEHASEAINVEFLSDDKGQKGLTHVAIELELTEEEENTLEETFDTTKYHQIIIPILNELIDLYRLKTHRWWVERISDHHVPDIKSECKYRKNHIGFIMSPNIQSIDPNFKKQKSDDIVKSYEAKQKLPIFVEYYLLALKNYHSARYDLSLVFINIALESLIFLLSNEVLGVAEHENLILAPKCKECGMPMHKKLREILSIVNKKIGKIDDEAILVLMNKVRRPNDNTLRNDIAHGKVLFLDVGNQHQKDVDLAISSFIELTKIYSKNILDYL